MDKEYKYDSISVRTKTGNKDSYDFCDYYVQDGVMTIFRPKTFEDKWEKKTYYKFEAHYPMECVERIQCVQK